MSLQTLRICPDRMPQIGLPAQRQHATERIQTPALGITMALSMQAMQMRSSGLRSARPAQSLQVRQMHRVRTCCILPATPHGAGWWSSLSVFRFVMG